ncbi:hypothetical protein DPMN_162619 [Dreissena polymorpha]|uniref:Uncharacterized protein n=1 Tax=Dreissena polymorpha TaxID=45954 RepID=A0A9D4IQQ5_DREPO|nr:hypothetical protein DPMN_162619 [Dreissena polymorpha]
MDTFLKRPTSEDAETAKKLKSNKKRRKPSRQQLSKVKKWMTEFNINLDYVGDSDNDLAFFKAANI